MVFGYGDIISVITIIILLLVLTILVLFIYWFTNVFIGRRMGHVFRKSVSKLAKKER